ncbi:hypothetical protein [Dyadobacter crusticola]|uniref:hypothetical protein n=1 Tax=Dyadobacter crusticola TaxID=292407 RepID=UPI0004E23328|nr:hypothetical protein [Dyadobacter crusticola]
MNSSEQKDFEHATPTEDEINGTIDRLQEKLKDAGTEGELAEAYTQAIEILSKRITNYEELVLQSKSEASKTLGVLAVRYLNGETGTDVLLNYPFKKQ